jgi:ABC-2 type transport system permease protein
MNAVRSAVPSVRLFRLWWIGFTTFVFRAYRDIVRYSILTIAPSAITTALYFIVFGELVGRRIGSMGSVEYKQYIAPGLIMMPVIANSYSQAALSFFTAKFHRLIDEHLVSPLPAWLIVLSYAAGGLIRGILVGVAVGAVALLFTHTQVQHPLLMIGALLLATLVSSLAGFVTAVFAKSFDQINAVLSFVLTPLVYCSGVFYSIAVLPAWAQALSRANPIFYMVELFRFSMLGVSDVHAGIAVSFMLFASLALFVVAAKLIERGIGIRE